MALANASSSMLTSIGDNEHPGFVTAISGNIATVSPLNKILAKELGQVYYIMSKKVPLNSSFLFFFKDCIYLFLERGEGREKEGRRNINVWLPFVHPQPPGPQPRHVP